MGMAREKKRDVEIWSEREKSGLPHKIGDFIFYTVCVSSPPMLRYQPIMKIICLARIIYAECN